MRDLTRGRIRTDMLASRYPKLAVLPLASGTTKQTRACGSACTSSRGACLRVRLNRSAMQLFNGNKTTLYAARATVVQQVEARATKRYDVFGSRCPLAVCPACNSIVFYCALPPHNLVRAYLRYSCTCTSSFTFPFFLSVCKFGSTLW